MSHESIIKHQKENEHRKIISQLYDQELPEMPTMRDEQSNYTSKNEYDVPDAEAQRRISDPDQAKRDKIWEEIEKEAEDDEEDGEEDKDSDANESDPEIDGVESEDSEDSEKDNNS